MANSQLLTQAPLKLRLTNWTQLFFAKVLALIPYVKTPEGIPLTRGIDVSAYQINLPWAELVQHGLAFAIVKGDQLTATDNHIALARAAGVPIVGEYFWDDPSISAAAQIACFAADIEAHDPDFIALDVEQYWAYWQDYWDYLSGKIKQADIRRKSPQAITDHALAVARGLAARFPKKKVVIYSGTWFVLGYAQPLVYSLAEFPLWWAHYTSNAIQNVTWAQWEALPPQPFKVWMPNDSLHWLMWQFSSTFVYPNGQRLDQNVFLGDLPGMLAWCAGEVTLPQPGLTLESLDERVSRIEGLLNI